MDDIILKYQKIRDSQHKANRKYRETDRGREVMRINQREWYARNKDTPEYKEKMRLRYLKTKEKKILENKI